MSDYEWDYDLQTRVYKPKPDPKLDGEWDADARALISLSHFREMFNNQMPHWEREAERVKWGQLAATLKVAEPDDPDMLHKMQQYIATTPPEMRCPCRRGELLNSAGHFPGCEGITESLMFEDLCEQWDKEEAAAKRELERVAEEIEEEKRQAAHFNEILNESLYSRLSPETKAKLHQFYEAEHAGNRQRTDSATSNESYIYQ